MKKIVFGIVIGALLTLGISAAADGISKIGKSITNEYVIKINDEELSVKAIAVDGMSYAPVRVIAETAGFAVNFANNEVLLNRQVTTPIEGGASVADIDNNEYVLNATVEALKINIAGLEDSYKTYSDADTKEQILLIIEEHKDKLQKAEKELAEFQSQK